MGIAFSILLFIVGMASCNTILVLPRYRSNMADFRRMAIINEITSIVFFLLFFIVLVFDFGGPMRMIDRILNPMQSSITLPIVLLGAGSLFFHIPLIWLISNHKPTSLNLAKLVCILVVIWSIVTVSFLTVLRGFIFVESLLALVLGAACFVFSILAAGQLLLLLVCKTTDQFSQIKCSKLSLTKVRKQTMIFSAFYALSFAINTMIT